MTLNSRTFYFFWYPKINRRENVKPTAAATAEAEALRLQKMNISPDLIELRKIEANLKAIEKWNGILPRVTGSGAIPLIGVGDVLGK